MFAARFTANWLEPHCESIVEQATSTGSPAASADLVDTSADDLSDG
jgi:hypothetical protein